MSLEDQVLGFCLQLRVEGQKPVIALNGPVGAGKSTLARHLQQHCAEQGVRLAIASIDDAYLPYPQRLERMAGNPFGVNRVPPGSHDPDLLQQAIQCWRGGPGSILELPRFDKTLRAGQGDPSLPWRGEADALLLEGWMVACRPLSDQELEAALSSEMAADFSAAERAWVRRCNQALGGYQTLWDQLSSLVMLWPQMWHLPRRWRFQAEAQQRRRGGGWMNGQQLDGLVKASLRSLPPSLYLEPRLPEASLVRVLNPRRCPLFEGSGVDALNWIRDQASSPSSSATG
jgi:D-glycerate 3-kinase